MNDCTEFATPMQGDPAPTRMVHYRSYGSVGGKYAPRCRAAIITEVPDLLSEQPNTGPEGYVPAVSLAVLNPTGLFFDTEVPHGPEGEGGTWHVPERR